MRAGLRLDCRPPGNWWRKVQAAVSKPCETQAFRPFEETMKFQVVMKWPSSDILPRVQEAQTATAALKACMASMRGGCQIKSICRTDEGGTTQILLPRDLVRLARQEGYKVKFPPRVRRARKTLSGILLAILASMLPNSFGDFCTLMEFGTYRVAIRREEGARRPSKRPTRSVEILPTTDELPPDRQA
jgi:hypothetical protein